MEQDLNRTDDTAEFLEKTSCLEYIQVTFVDINGVPRARIYSADNAEDLVSHGASIDIASMAFSSDGSFANIADHLHHLLGNVMIRLVPSTLRNCPFLGQGVTGARFGQVSIRSWGKAT